MYYIEKKKICFSILVVLVDELLTYPNIVVQVDVAFKLVIDLLLLYIDNVELVDKLLT
jgi:hypothetical protein